MGYVLKDQLHLLNGNNTKLLLRKIRQVKAEDSNEDTR